MQRVFTDFMFAELKPGKPIDIIREGTFTDGWGREMTYAADDINMLADNFAANKAQQRVPIDIDHEYAKAAGWFRTMGVVSRDFTLPVFEFDKDGNKKEIGEETQSLKVLIGEPEWNELGRELIGEQVYKYTSASIDTEGMIIRAVSLVNFPAVKGLRAVELSEGIYGLSRSPGFVDRVRDRVLAAINAAFNSAPEAELAEPKTEVMNMAKDKEQDVNMAELEERIEAKVRAEMEVKLTEKAATVAELTESITAKVEAEMTAKFARRQGLVEFAEGICNGDAGLSAKPDDVVEALEGLDDEAAERVKALLQAKVADFSEIGTEREGKGERKELPAEYASLVKDRPDNVSLAEVWAGLEDDLGDMGGYDLSEFEKEK